MREIKFRAWDKKHKCMYNSKYMGNYFLSDINENTNDENGLVFMQYTGLKDKNGVEIYEGDIVAYYCPCDCELTYRYKIEWCDYWTGWCLVDRNASRDYFGDDSNSKGFQIIGNIHENKEILNG